MLHRDPNRWLDAQLREIPVPDGFRQRLRKVALADDGDLDEHLREIAVPAGMDTRLRLAVADDDAGLDVLLRDVPVPYRVLCKLRATPGYRIRLRQVAGWAVAATLLIATGLSYLGVAVALLVAARPMPAPTPPELAWYVTGELLPDASEATSGVVALEMPSAASPAAAEMAIRPFPELSPPSNLAGRAPAQSPRNIDEFGLFDYPWSGGQDPLLDVTPYRWGVFGAHESFDDPLGWQESRSLEAHGIPAPTAAGFDSSILVRFGVFPFVSTAADDSLRSVSVPLDVGTDSFELTRRSVAGGRLPPPDRVRTEEFLAAIDYEFPKPKGKAIGLSLRAGPSPFLPGVVVLQSAVQAAELATAPRPAVHLVLAVDESAGADWPQKLAVLRGALQDMQGWLNKDDRLSVVAFHRNAEVLVERAAPNHVDQIIAALENRTGSTATNLGAGLTVAYALATRPDRSAPAGKPLVVLFTDAPADLPLGAAARIERRLAEAAREGVKLDVIAVRSASSPRDIRLRELAAAGEGRFRRVNDARHLKWVLRESIAGQPQVVAEDVQLTVRFNPKSVPFYRVLGHEPGAKTADSTCSFHSGQAATALFDVGLRQDLSPNDVLATAEVTWREPGSGVLAKETAVIRRADVPALLAEAPLSLQAAVVAAEAGEILRRSAYTQLRPRPGTLAGTLELAEQLDFALREMPSFRDLTQVVEQAIRARPYRGGGAR